MQGWGRADAPTSHKSASIESKRISQRNVCSTRKSEPIKIQWETCAMSTVCLSVLLSVCYCCFFSHLWLQILNAKFQNALLVLQQCPISISNSIVSLSEWALWFFLCSCSLSGCLLQLQLPHRTIIETKKKKWKRLQQTAIPLALREISCVSKKKNRKTHKIWVNKFAKVYKKIFSCSLSHAA